MRADRKLDKAHDMKIFKALSDLDGEIPADYDAYLSWSAFLAAVGRWTIGGGARNGRSTTFAEEERHLLE
jgi:hypothetical protein